MSTDKDYPEQVRAICNFAWRLFPKAVRPKKPDKNWLDTVDKLIRLDEETEEDIKAVILWARNHDFWGQQFLSLRKLRTTDKQGVKYYYRFKIQMNNEHRKTDSRNIQPVTNNDWSGFGTPQ